MSDLPAASLDWLAAHHGVITTGALRQHGVGRSTLKRLLARGVLSHASKGVFVIGSSRDTLEQRCAIQCATHPHGFITGPTAGMLAGLRRMPRTSSLHVSVAHGSHLPRTRGVTWRQTTVIWACDREERDGVMVASWPRLAFDLAADLKQLDHVSVVNQLLHEKRVTADELVAIDQRLGHAARPGSGRFRRTLTSLGGRAPNESHPEVVLAEALRRRDVPVENQTKVIRSSNGRSFRVDLAVPAVRWGIELDIHPEHRSIEGHAADAERRRELHRMAWQLETVSEHDMADPERLADDLAGLYRLRVTAQAHPSVSGGGHPRQALGCTKHSGGQDIRWWGPRCGGRRRRPSTS
jgi:hypothetical protein